MYVSHKFLMFFCISCHENLMAMMMVIVVVMMTTVMMVTMMIWKFKIQHYLILIFIVYCLMETVL
jgi:hypothetical protein